MKEFSLPNVSVAGSGGEYFQVHFSDKQDSDDATAKPLGIQTLRLLSPESITSGFGIGLYKGH